MKSFGSIGLVVAIALAGGCAGEQDAPLTFEEFTDQAYQEPDTGNYIVNGDELVETTAQMREVYDRYLDSWNDAHRAGDVAAGEAPLIVNRVGGADDKWNSSTAANLTYCISRSSFTTAQYNAVVSAMNSATASWEGTARVNYVYNSSLDGSCSRTSATVFNVRRVSTSQYLARAFFPSTSRSGREVLISTSSFGNISPYTLAGILRHELGHTIGFRHEHTRPESGTCFEDNSWRALTTYDSASVMHYPQCNGTNSGDLRLTSRDQSGARSLYP